MATANAKEAQIMDALDRANRVRLDRAAMKRRIRAGEVKVVDLIAPYAVIPEEIESMPVAQLLMAQTRWGASRARRFLTPLVITENRPLRTLTRRERSRLAGALRGGRVRDERILTPSLQSAA